MCASWVYGSAIPNTVSTEVSIIRPSVFPGRLAKKSDKAPTRTFTLRTDHIIVQSKTAHGPRVGKDLSAKMK